jgi:hypothetical protein
VARSQLVSVLTDWFVGNYGQETLKVLANAMKLFSVGAHHYPIGHLSWADYTPQDGIYDPPSYPVALYGEQSRLTPLPIAIPATISYLGIAETLENKNQLFAIGGNLGDTEWNRAFGLVDNELSNVHTIGSLEGVWEGVFTVSLRSMDNTLPCLLVTDSTRISRRTAPSLRGQVRTL